MYYLDASFIVASFVTDETGSATARQWLRKNSQATMAVSLWVSTEVSSALSIKVRRGDITLADRAELLAQWSSLQSANAKQLDVEPACFIDAAAFADRHTLGLRAGDALHIAIAARHGCTLVTLDQIMANAALECGVPVAEF
jgi:uncharacterized protein